jgi:endonuclease-8
MPEGDTVFVTAARVHAALAGHTLMRTDFRVPRYATVDFSGRSFLEARARGKHLLFRIEGGHTIHSHLKMEGEWHLYRSGERWRMAGHHARAVLEVDGRSAVGFRLGKLEVIATPEEADVVGHLGPDLLGDDWDAGLALANLLADPARAIGDALIDQTVMAGLGNVYRSEICFLSGLDPRTPVGRVPNAAKVVALAKRVIEANRATGHQITTGDPRRGRRHWVYGRRDERCRRCGTPIARRQGEVGTRDRVTYWCPACQPPPA